MKRRFSHMFTHHFVGLGIAATLTAAPLHATAQGMLSDGWTGPVEMTGHTLDHAMTALNEFVMAKQVQSDMMATLDAAPGGDFAEIAVASAITPFERAAPERTEFGWPIDGGKTLDAHLVAFNDDLAERGDDLFLRIARAEADKSLDFGMVAADVTRSPSDAGRIYDDVTLDGEMLALRDGMREFDDRLARLSRSVPEVTGTSFERYVESLALF